MGIKKLLEKQQKLDPLDILVLQQKATKPRTKSWALGNGEFYRRC